MAILHAIFVFFLILGCKSGSEEVTVSRAERDAFEQTTGEPVVIAGTGQEYEITIIDPGFYSWLKGFARAEGFYSQSFLENRNAIYVLNWNQRVLLPGQYPSSLYEWPIDYDSQIDYGYEVNYKLYNYFIFFQRKYDQRLGPFIPRL